LPESFLEFHRLAMRQNAMPMGQRIPEREKADS